MVEVEIERINQEVNTIREIKHNPSDRCLQIKWRARKPRLSHVGVPFEPAVSVKQIPWVILSRWFTSRSGPHQRDWLFDVENEIMNLKAAWDLVLALFNPGLDSGLAHPEVMRLALPGSPCIQSGLISAGLQRPSHPTRLWIDFYPRHVGIKKHLSNIVRFSLNCCQFMTLGQRLL